MRVPKGALFLLQTAWALSGLGTIMIENSYKDRGGGNNDEQEVKKHINVDVYDRDELCTH